MKWILSIFIFCLLRGSCTPGQPVNNQGRQLTREEWQKLSPVLSELPNQVCADTIRRLLTRGIDGRLFVMWDYPPRENSDVIELTSEEPGPFEKIRMYEGSTPLMIAVRYGYADLSKMLIDMGADIKAKNQMRGMDVVAMAEETQDETFIMQFIDWATPKTGVKYFTDNTGILFYAAVFHHFNLLEKMIEMGSDINAPDKITRYTVLSQMVMKRDTVVIGKLLGLGADLNAGLDGFRPFDAVAKLPYFEDYIVEYLLRHGMKPYFNGVTQVGPIEVMKAMLESGTDINAQDSAGCSFLWHAAENDNYKLVKYLIEQGADVNLANHNNRFPIDVAGSSCFDLLIAGGAKQGVQTDYFRLFDAVRNGEIDIVEELVHKGVDVNHSIGGDYAINTQGDVSTETHLEILDILLKAGANIGVRNRSGYSILPDKAAVRDSVIVKYLLERGADPDIWGYTDRTALHRLSAVNYSESLPGVLSMMKTLIEYGADVNALDKDGNTPLLTNMEALSVSDYQEETIRLLIAYGASSRIENFDAMSPLDLLKRKKFSPEVKRLLERQDYTLGNYREKLKPVFDLYKGKIGIGVVINLLASDDIDYTLTQEIVLGDSLHTRFNEGATSLSVAAALGFDEIVIGLIANEASVDIRDGRGYSPLGYAVEKKRYKTAEILLKFNASPYYPDTNNPFKIATRLKNYKILDLLLRYHPDLNMYDDNPLIDAVLLGDVRLVSYFLNRKANPEAHDEQGRTVLMVAAEKGNADIVKMLLIAGADPLATDEAGSSVWDYADGNEDVLKILPKKEPSGER
ncbi:ankyrin repeat domain-containing protein [Coprobacter tertius]|uniref:Ankyrin repeat domain-containing protein n=1 Tax=Coprobacter tertius TaxID=2944915 RepID=A0ABT1MFI6_9BACT|nr:ankyrin repeat domain-containing protein [Coprobacter tertius]MCP9611114.1 ankyrin repeat domain-containing protein [Coprobacter tertius]